MFVRRDVSAILAEVKMTIPQDPWEGSDGTALAMCRPTLDNIATALSNGDVAIKTRFEAPVWVEFHTTDGKVLITVRAHTRQYIRHGSSKFSKIEVFTDENNPDFHERIAALFRDAFPGVKVELQHG